jgi:hypothetical protein
MAAEVLLPFRGACRRALGVAQRHYVGLGTPAEASWLSWLKGSVFVLVAIHAVCAGLLILPGAALARLLRKGLAEADTWALWALPGVLLAGYACFYISYYLPSLGKALSLGLGLCSVAVLFRTRRATNDREIGPMAAPVWAWLLLSLFVFIGLYVTDGEAGPWTANHRYSPAVWSTDDQLSRMVAENLYRDRSILGIFGHWKTSDRPPLLAGAYALLRPWWEPFLGIGDNVRLGARFYQATGTVLMTAWWCPAWLLLSRSGFGRRETVWTVLICATAGFTFFNMSYTWPKLLAGWLALGAFVLMGDNDPARPAYARAPLVHAALLAALALLSHGGVVFGLLPLSPLIVKRARWRPGAIALAALGASSLLVPWALWQRYEDPPGNALVKFAFAGTWGFGEVHKGVWETMKDAYAPLTWSSWLSSRAESLRLLFGLADDPLLPRFPRTDDLGQLRLGDFLYAGSTLRWLHLGWPLWILALCRGGAATSAVRHASSWISFGLAGVLLNLVVTFRLQIVPTQSFLSMLLVVLGLAALIARAPRTLRVSAIGLHLAYFSVVWIASPLLDAHSLRWDVLLGWLLAAGALAASLRGACRNATEVSLAVGYPFVPSARTNDSRRRA